MPRAVRSIGTTDAEERGSAGERRGSSRSRRDRRVVAVTPLGPRSCVRTHAGIAETTRHEIGQRRAMVRLAIRDDELVPCDTSALEQRLEIGAQTERTIAVHQLEPVEMERARYSPAACGRDLA